MLGGVTTALLCIGAPVTVTGRSGDRFPAALVLSVLLSLLFSRVRRSRTPARTVRVRIEAAGIRLDLTGLCDSGLVAREPIGERPVILVKRRAAEEPGPGDGEKT